jgi:hypothetical protein
VNPVTWSGTVVGSIRETAGDATSAQQAWRINQILEMPLGGDWAARARAPASLVKGGPTSTTAVPTRIVGVRADRL